MKILAVDDELSALRILERCIKACDPECELYSTDDSSKALEEAKNGTFVPDIACMDIEMPSPNGIELGKELKKINPHLNVIFVTGYPEYMRDALNMFVSGYLLKPVTREDLQVQLDHLRFPVNEKISGFHAQTFGEFEFFKDGEPVVFDTKKAKELLAILIDQRGASLSKREICSTLFGDKYDATVQDYFKKIVRSLKLSLAKADGLDILIQSRNSYAVNTKLFTCDYYEYLDGKPAALNAYQGYYMKQYSWADGIY